MRLSPYIRYALTALAAALGAATAVFVDNETVRIIAGIALPTLAALGIVPPHVSPTVVTRYSRIDNSDDHGQSLIEVALFLLIVLVILAIFLPNALHR